MGGPENLEMDDNGLVSADFKLEKNDLGADFGQQVIQETREIVSDEEEAEDDEDIEEEEEFEEEDEDSEEEDEAEESPKSKKKALKFDDEPEPEKPVSYQQAMEYYHKQFIALSFKESGYDVKDDLSNLQELAAQAVKEDPLGWEKVIRAAQQYATNNANEYHKQKIQPYENYHIKKGVQKFVLRMNEHYPDIQDYLPAMNELQEEFFKKWPELINDPVRAIPLMYHEAKMSNSKGKKAKNKAKAKPASRKKVQMETSPGMQRTTSKRVKENKNPRDVDFSKLGKDGLDQFVGGIF